MITQTLDLNLIPGRVLPMVNVSQYDKDSRTLEFTIYNGDQTFDLTGITAYIQGLKPDGHGFNYSATIADGKVTANVEEQMTAVSGRVMCEIILMDGTDRAGTGNFILNVEAAAMPDGSNMSDSDYSYIEQLIEDAQEAQTEAEESAEDAEAWAVGERNGVPVGPTDPTYENNAHYWAQQAGGGVNDFVGATALTPGAHGLVPAPAAGDQNKFLSGDGTWKNAPAGGHTIQNPSGTDMTQRAKLQFAGTGVSVTDDSVNDKTVVQFTGGGGGLLPHIVITSEVGATVTLVNGGTTISTTETSSGIFEADIPSFGTWTITVLDGGNTYTQTIVIDTVKIYTATVTAFSATIMVTYPSGATCTCTGNGESYTASGTPYTFTVHSTGTFTITVTLDGVSKTDTMVITEDGQASAVTIKFGTINLTLANEFVGLSITCVNGGTSISKTAGSTSLVFRPPTTGTWTMSGTVNGVTYSTDATISDLDTAVSASLQTVPDGSTVLPTDDIQIWLRCAGITDKAYTTLAEVLADSTTLLALISDNNAVDYLVRSTSFARGGIALVPTLSADDGNVIASSVNSATYDDWMAFNGTNASKGWLPANSDTVGNAYVGYHFTSKKVVGKTEVYLYRNTPTSTSNKVKIQGSNDGITWTDVSSETSTQYTDTLYTITCSPDQPYEYYRMLITASANLGAGEGWHVQFYNEDGLTDNATAMTDIGANNYAADTLLADSDWQDGICNSTYFESVLNVKVPTMTSATTPSGECFGEKLNPSFPAYYAFDGDDSTRASNNVGLYQNIGMGYTFTSPKKIYKTKLRTRPDFGTHVSMILRASNNKSDWTTLIDSMPMAASETEYAFNIPIANVDEYTSYEVFGSSTVNTEPIGFTTIQFYGRADV